MRNRIQSAFDEICMSTDCENHILAAMREIKDQTKVRPHFMRITAAAACLMAILLLLSNPIVAEALDKIFSSGLQKEVSQHDVDITVVYRSPDGKFTDTTTYDGSIAVAGHGRNNLLVTPEWYVEQDSRLYFAANGEWIDVTDLISMDAPFTYIYTDEGGIIHYICIGGVYDSDPEVSNVGYAEWYYDPTSTDANGIGGEWIGGYSDNYWNKETDNDWPWLKKAKQEMGIPWG